MAVIAAIPRMHRCHTDLLAEAVRNDASPDNARRPVENGRCHAEAVACHIGFKLEVLLARPVLAQDRSIRMALVPKSLSRW